MIGTRDFKIPGTSKSSGKARTAPQDQIALAAHHENGMCDALCFCDGQRRVPGISERFQRYPVASGGLDEVPVRRLVPWIMPSYFAARLALTRGLDGGPAYPGLGALGGVLAGLPVHTSASAEAEVNSDDLSDVVLLDASQVSFVEGAPALQVE